MTMEQGRQIEQPVKTPTLEEILEISKKVVKYTENCIKCLKQPKSLQEKVHLGILSKLISTYVTLINHRSEGYGWHVINSALLRIIYELSLSLLYMLKKHDSNKEPNIYEDFKRSSLIRLHDTLESEKTSQYRNFQFTKESIKNLEKTLKENNYDIKQKLPTMPKTWHPKTTYKEMAHVIGDEIENFYYDMYNRLSGVIHPEWFDIKNYIPEKTEIEESVEENDLEQAEKILFLQAYPIGIATCILLRTVQDYTKYLGKISRSKKVRIRHKKSVIKINRIHENMHNY